MSTVLTKSQIYAALTEIFHEVFMRDDLAIGPTTTADDIEEWDSFKQIKIILAAQERFGIKLRTREIDRLKSVGDLASTIAAKFTHTQD